MKTLSKDDLYNNLSQFLETRGIKLKKGSYARALENSCGLLTDAINLGQESFELARTELDRKLDQMRQTVHEATAPRQAGSKPAPTAAPTAPANKPVEKPAKGKKAAELKTQALKRQAATRRKRAAVQSSSKNPKSK